MKWWTTLSDLDGKLIALSCTKGENGLNLIGEENAANSKDRNVSSEPSNYWLPLGSWFGVTFFKKIMPN